MTITACALSSRAAATELHIDIEGDDEPAALSDLIPLLENMGARVLRADALSAHTGGWRTGLMLGAEGLERLRESQVRQDFESLLMAVAGEAVDSDSLNRLVVVSGLNAAQIQLLRACIRYGVQLGLPFGEEMMAAVLVRNAAVARMLVRLFEQRFDPALSEAREAQAEQVLQEIQQQIERIDSLDDDRVLSALLEILQAVTRSNYYCVDRQRQPGAPLSFKLNTAAISFAPPPVPAHEIFVFARDVEGVHLRAGAVARGGIRWSERQADYRTEILGLLKAQIVKNSVIVPAGAKGGFVCKNLTGAPQRQTVERAYRTFIGALLEITDNRVGERVEAPLAVVRHDADDPYLVVAADKGTAVFSDIANAIAGERGFWLDDAFASGGSHGYDHKKLGITARGAWESVKRLFLERNKDIQREPFTVIGIGDMAGDVFGNGMLLSKQIRLVAAFNHRHIFIDPDPDPARSFAERQRLFQMPGSGWNDYDPALLSPGGAVYSRSQKQIRISTEAQRALGLESAATLLTPDALIQAILRAPVELLWNGGIGTYVKASTETQAEVGDKSNDALRVNADELRVCVVGEGGNLGLTQRARVEFARAGGLIHTDAVDNSGGVDCSDHEVNIKILLAPLVAAGRLTREARDRLLDAMTDEVTARVIANNFAQSKMLSQANHTAPRFLDGHAHLIGQLTQQQRLQPRREHLPDEASLAARRQSQQGLSRPEIAVLLAYSKAVLFERLAAFDLIEDERLAGELLSYFPDSLSQEYRVEILGHPLRREILATHLANQVVNRMGATFCNYLLENSDADAARLVKAFVVARDLLDIDSLDRALDQQVGRVPYVQMMELQLRLHEVMHQTIFWLFRHTPAQQSCQDSVARYSEAVSGLRRDLPAVLPEAERELFCADRDSLLKVGLPQPLAEAVAALHYLPVALEIEEVACATRHPLRECLPRYLTSDQVGKLFWLERKIEALPIYDKWGRKARETLHELVHRTVRQLAIEEIQAADDGEGATSLAGVQPLLAELRSMESVNVSMLATVVGQMTLMTTPETRAG